MEKNHRVGIFFQNQTIFIMLAPALPDPFLPIGPTVLHNGRARSGTHL